MNTLAMKTKVNRIGLLGKIVSIVLIVLMAVSCVALVASGIILAALPDDSVTVGMTTNMDIQVNKNLMGPYFHQIRDEDMEKINASIRINGDEFSEMTAEKTETGLLFNGSTDRITFQIGRLTSAAIAGLIYCACLLVVFVFLLRLSDAFRTCDTPFSDLVIKRMSVFAWVLLGGAAVSAVAEGVVNTLLSRNLDLEFAINPVGMDTGFHVSVNFAPIFIALIVLFLTIIFRYGAQLQQQADETL